MRTRIAKQTIICVCVLALTAGVAHAEKIPQRLQEAYEKDGVNAIMIGKLAPTVVVKELLAAAAEVKKAREELKKEYKRSQLVSTVLTAFAMKLMSLEDAMHKVALQAHVRASLLDDEVQRIKKDLNILRKGFIEGYTAVATHLDAANNAIARLDARVARLEAKQWGIGLHVATSFAWSTDGAGWAQFDTLGIMGYWASPRMMITADIGGGINAHTKALSWNFGGSAEWRINSKFSVGGNMQLSQDLGDMEGAERMTWTAGPVGRYIYWGGEWTTFSITASPFQFGACGKRGFDGEKPTWTPNIGGLLTIDYFLL
jgi:hypothetical protein